AAGAVPRGAAVRRLLRRRVTLSAPARDETPGGGADFSMQTAVTVWAAIRARGANERAEAGRLHTRAAYELTLRHRAGIAPGWRAEWGGAARRVVAAFDPDGARRRTILICEEET